MKQLFLLLATVILLMLPTISLATEWVECYQGEAYSIEFLANPGSNEIIDFKFSKSGNTTNVSNWAIVRNEIIFEKRSISFKAITDKQTNSFVALESLSEKGELVENGQSIEVYCDWSLFEAL